MEWTGRQQIWFLLQSVALGFFQGFLLDVVSSFGRFGGRFRWKWSDVCFGPIAAVITFFGALIIMDGQLHPILLGGIFVGMAIEHKLIGFWMCRCIRWLGNFVRTGRRMSLAFFCVCVMRLKNMWHHNRKTPKKGEK